MKVGSILLITGASALAACSGDGGRTETVGSKPSAATTAPPVTELIGPVGIGDATFQRAVSRDDAIEAGFDPEMVDQIMGDRGVVQFTIRFEGPRYTQSQRTDDGPADVGDDGRQYIDDEGHLVTVSESPGAPGATSVLDWTLDGDQLTLTCLAGCRGEDGLDASGNLVMEGTWTRSG